MSTKTTITNATFRPCNSFGNTTLELTISTSDALRVINQIQSLLDADEKKRDEATKAAAKAEAEAEAKNKAKAQAVATLVKLFGEEAK